jgi:GNAT superfamily N-acetyltransferase
MVLYESGSDRGQTVLVIRPIRDALPTGFAVLRPEARAEGFHFVEQLMADWDSGDNRFDRLGEALLAAFVGDELAGMGGITQDPIVRNALRMRRFYVRLAFRHQGIGRALADSLLSRPQSRSRTITVNAPTVAGAQFWEGLGFVPEPKQGHTHVRPAAGGGAP